MKNARISMSAFVFLVLAHAVIAQSAGSARVPLALSITPSAKPLEFRVTIENNGTQALNLILGTAFANGRRQFVDAVTYSLHTPDGRQLQLEATGPAIIAGRVDPLIVPLPSGASFSFPVNIAKCCWDPKHKIFDLALAEGRYTVAAEYTGKPISAYTVNLDVPGIALIPFWTGTIVSSPVAFTVVAATRKKREP